MRASERGAHISGAEKIVAVHNVGAAAQHFAERALRHPKGQPAELSISIERLEPAAVRAVQALPVFDEIADSVEEARQVVLDRLRHYVSGPVAQEVWEQLIRVRDMRGAMLIDADVGTRLEPDPQRGVRVSRLGDANDIQPGGLLDASRKSPAREALVLASKVMSHPDIVAEVCMSDDPDYTTGYVADATGYHRIPHMKEPGSARGGRVFVCRTNDVGGLIAYRESAPVLVEGIGE